MDLTASLLKEGEIRDFASLVAQMVKNLPAMRETWVRSLGGEDPLEKETTPVFLPGESQGQRSPVGCSPRGHRVGHG